MLTHQQCHFFVTFGYVILRRTFTAQEIHDITQAADVRWAANLTAGSGTAQDQHLAPFIESDADLDWLADDDRIHGAMAMLLGAGSQFAVVKKVLPTSRKTIRQALQFPSPASRVGQLRRQGGETPGYRASHG